MRFTSHFKKNLQDNSSVHHVLGNGLLYRRSFAEQDGNWALKCSISPCLWPTSKFTMSFLPEGASIVVVLYGEDILIRTLVKPKVPVVPPEQLPLPSHYMYTCRAPSFSLVTHSIYIYMHCRDPGEGAPSTCVRVNTPRRHLDVLTAATHPTAVVLTQKD